MVHTSYCIPPHLFDAASTPALSSVPALPSHNRARGSKRQRQQRGRTARTSTTISHQQEPTSYPTAAWLLRPGCVDSRGRQQQKHIRVHDKAKEQRQVRVNTRQLSGVINIISEIQVVFIPGFWMNIKKLHIYFHLDSWNSLCPKPILSSVTAQEHNYRVFSSKLPCNHSVWLWLESGFSHWQRAWNVIDWKWTVLRAEHTPSQTASTLPPGMQSSDALSQALPHWQQSPRERNRWYCTGYRAPRPYSGKLRKRQPSSPPQNLLPHERLTKPQAQFLYWLKNL